MTVSSNGGSTYDTSSIYNNNSWRYNSGGDANGGGTQAFFAIDGIGADHISNNTNYGISGTIHIYNPTSTSLYKMLHGEMITFSSATSLPLASGQGDVYTSTTAINAFQILFASGNIASGTVRVYGVMK